MWVVNRYILLIIISDSLCPVFQVPAGSTTLTLAALDSASILLVIEGDAQGTSDKALSLRRGSVLFIAANQSVGLAVGAGGLRMFRAYCSG